MDRSTLPARLWVGVVGHRSVVGSEALTARVGAAMEQIREAAERQCGQQVGIGVITAAAEGADRLLAEQILDRYGARLEVVLPMPTDEYQRDFVGDPSIDAFAALLGRADDVFVGQAQSYREDAYVWAAERIVARSDVLIAVWDGEPARGPGGTSDIVEMAATAKPPLPVVHIDPTGSQSSLRGALRFDHLRHLIRLGAPPGPADASGRRVFDLDADAPAEVSEAAAWFAPYADRADAEAVRCQRADRWGTLGLIAGAWVATCLAAMHGLLWPKEKALGYLEIATLLTLVGVFGWLIKADLHRRWLDARALAEWCRAALYLHISAPASVPLERAEYVPQSRHWLNRAREDIWRGRPAAAPEPSATTIAACRRWLDGQIEYYRSQSRRLQRTLSLIDVSVWALFVLTIVAVVVGVVVEIDEESHVSPHGLAAFAAIVLPAAGGALAAVRASRDYHRNADRAERASADLAQIARHLDPESSPQRAHALVSRAAARLMQENHDWFEVMTYHDPELHA